MSKPIIGISTCVEQQGLHQYHQTGEKYITALRNTIDCVPVLIPSIGQELDIKALLNSLDGILFTGSYSNIEPHQYNGGESDGNTKHDPKRDATTLGLIPVAVDSGMPVFAICRGCQEMNVAYGGTLHQKVHEIDGLNDHREDDTLDLDGQYGFAHTIQISEGGILDSLSENKSPEVNSVHWQGVNELGNNLSIEATSPDGLIEAFRVTDSRAFSLAVQWHPEYKVTEIPFYKKLFQAFGNAVESYAKTKV